MKLLKRDEEGYLVKEKFHPKGKNIEKSFQRNESCLSWELKSAMELGMF